MGFLNDGLQVQEYKYDFATLGGAQAEIDLTGPALPIGAVVVRATLHVTTAFTSGGSSTLIWGTTTDPNGYSGTAIAVASLTANALFAGNEAAGAPGALTWDTLAADSVRSDQHHVATVANGTVSVTIATADMTAGTCTIFVEYYLGS